MVYFILFAAFALACLIGLVIYLSGPAYIIRDGKLLYPDGRPVEVYDGNDPKHFPKWTEANYRAAGLIK